MKKTILLFALLASQPVIAASPETEEQIRQIRAANGGAVTITLRNGSRATARLVQYVPNQRRALPPPDGVGEKCFQIQSVDDRGRLDNEWWSQCKDANENITLETKAYW